MFYFNAELQQEISKLEFVYICVFKLIIIQIFITNIKTNPYLKS